MKQENFRIFILSLNLCIFSLLLLLQNSCAADVQYEACEPKRCHHGPTIRYPFYLQDQQKSYCGFPQFKISCHVLQGYPILCLSGIAYVVEDISYESNLIRVYNEATRGSEATCLREIRNLATPAKSAVLRLFNNSSIRFLLNCSEPLSGGLQKYRFHCNEGNRTKWGLVLFNDSNFLSSALQQCRENVVVPVERGEGNDRLRSNGVVDYETLLRKGFELKWRVSSCNECGQSGGRCGFNASTIKFKCFCPDRPHSARCRHEPVAGKSKTKIIIIAVLGAVIMILTLSLVVILVLRRRKNGVWGSSRFIPHNTSSTLSKKLDLEQDGKYFGIQVFSYSELEEATNSFDSSKELGDGGFGTVYYGKLGDGREVAVKRLYEHNSKRMEQFRNEIEILTGLRHPNLVTLYGCTSRCSRELLLVYEYIPNGTVSDHLHGERAKDGSLTWPIRMNIAVEAASALAYLHASGIIHRDVKTSNILLHENFCVKVADFGLSRHCPTGATHVSTAPQGTPGYVDPEYHEFYHLTDKSDVYSFGVVLIELISSMPAVDISRHRHEINLSNLAMNRIIRHAFHELIDPSMGFETDAEIMRMTTSVAELAFRCLQSEKDMRPAMTDVLETLKEIQGSELKNTVEQERDNKNDSVSGGSTKVPSPPGSNGASLPLLKLPVSPISVTDSWVVSSSTTSSSNSE
ncbi:hypothetical protein DM860_017977 [Cuscuta australis]|uniref:non-specific serine/threonine protein kinase n=1 Tax=Cuscuta australis TaxID=267555 RepID=A0A328DWF6_9ASTE|nr:hypothetical protein DM860_017977 [Cuscuta australis]